MATAIHIVTESGDHYNYCTHHNLTGEEVITYLAQVLGEECAYISEHWATLSSGEDVDVPISILIEDFEELV